MQEVMNNLCFILEGKGADAQYFSNWQIFAQKLSYKDNHNMQRYTLNRHNDEAAAEIEFLERRKRLLSDVYVIHNGKIWDISEDLIALYGKKPIKGNKEVQSIVKRFLSVSFPNLPLTNQAV